MSHFTVLVVGPEPEKQLAPFHEFECTGTDNEFVQEQDVRAAILTCQWTKKCSLEDAIEDVLGSKELIIPSAERRDLAGRHKFGHAVVQGGELIAAVRRTNPNKKWDWYQLGGRWTGYLRLMEGAKGQLGEPGVMTEPSKDKHRADAALKRDIDLAYMRDEAEMKARQKFRQFHRWVEGLPMPASWEHVLGRHGVSLTEHKPEDPPRVQLAREEYAQQPAIQRLRAHSSLMWIEEPERLWDTSEEAYAQAARANALVTFAVVKDGHWYERGEMGSWAHVSNEKPEGQWEAEFSKLLDALPGDTLLSLYDCHI